MRSIKARRIATIGVVGAALVATSVVALSQAAVAKTARPACTVTTDDGHWPAFVQGRPAGINPKTTNATYMWHDGVGWHIRVTHHRTNLRTFSGQLTTGGTFNTDVLGNQFFTQISTFFNYGAASAIVVILMIAVIPIMWYQVRHFRSEEAA